MRLALNKDHSRSWSKVSSAMAKIMGPLHRGSLLMAIMSGFRRSDGLVTGFVSVPEAARSAPDAAAQPRQGARMLVTCSDQRADGLCGPGDWEGIDEANYLLV